MVFFIKKNKIEMYITGILNKIEIKKSQVCISLQSPAHKCSNATFLLYANGLQANTVRRH